MKAELPSPTKPFTSYLKNRSRTSFYFFPTSPHEIKTIIGSLSKSGTGLIGISSKVLKILPDNIIEILSDIFNKSLSSGKFIDTLKISKIVPVHKEGSLQDINNYRPISILSCFSKLLEKIVYKRLNSFLVKNNFFFPSQFGFRKNQSTSYATSLLVSKVAEILDNGKLGLGLFLDLSKAFDCLDYNILFKKMEFFGIRGNALDWFIDYLTGRTQRVSFNGILSENTLLVNQGTPQGGVLGPLLFLIYINDLPNCLTGGSSILFADDTTLLLSHKNYDELIYYGNIELENLNKWLISNRLVLNTGKTKAIIFKTPQRRLPGPANALKINNNYIKTVNKTKFLGVIIDENLSWRYHIEQLKTKLQRNLTICSKIKRYCTQESLLNLYDSLIASNLRYCVTTWCYGNTVLLNSIQSVCNKFLRLVFHTNNIAELNQLKHLFSIMNVEQLLFKDLAITMHDIYSNRFSSYVLHPSCQRTDRSTRSFRNAHIPSRHNLSVTQQVLDFRSVRAWNSLPHETKYTNDEFSFENHEHFLLSRKDFKKHIKKYIFDNPRCYMCLNIAR